MITGGLRTVVAAVPIAGGALAQLWSEVDGHLRNKRIAALFEGLANRLQALEGEMPDLKARIAAMPDLARLLEDTVSFASREPDDTKRESFPTLLVNLIRDSDRIKAEERAYLLESFDALSTEDLKYLNQFKDSGYARGDHLTGTVNPPWAKLGGDSELEAQFDREFAPAMAATAKLEARGLIAATDNKWAFAEGGLEATWYKAYRQKAWRLMYLGRALLDLLSP